MAFKTEDTAISTLLATLSGLLFAVIIWFVLTKALHFEADLAAAIAALIGGAEFFVLRYVMSQKYTLPGDDL